MLACQPKEQWEIRRGRCCTTHNVQYINSNVVQCPCSMMLLELTLQLQNHTQQLPCGSVGVLYVYVVTDLQCREMYNVPQKQCSNFSNEKSLFFQSIFFLKKLHVSTYYCIYIYVHIQYDMYVYICSMIPVYEYSLGQKNYQ